jgi:hypothetical protein
MRLGDDKEHVRTSNTSIEEVAHRETFNRERKQVQRKQRRIPIGSVHLKQGYFLVVSLGSRPGGTGVGD